MTLQILDAIETKHSTFPLVNKQVITGRVPQILKNYNLIKGRNYNRSTIYRWVKRDDYPQPSDLERMFDAYVSTSFPAMAAGDLFASWRDWRLQFEIEPFLPFIDFWQVEEMVNALLSRVRTCHLAGDVYEERALLLEIRDKVDLLVKMTGVGVVPAEMRAK